MIYKLVDQGLPVDWDGNIATMAIAVVQVMEIWFQ